MKLLESYPEVIQEQAVERLRDLLEELRDEKRWEESYQNSQGGLVAAARRAKKEIAEGRAKPLKLDDL